MIKERYLRAGRAGGQEADPAQLTRLNVNQFFGIEIDEFPARIAEVAMWMTDHIANTRMGEDFGQSYARIPLVAAPGILHDDALEIDWNSVLSADRCSYVLGNPPFIGAKNQSSLQRAQVRRIANLGGSGGTLDYVAAWFLKAGAYVQGGHARIAFVSTNSITQGEQVAQLWPTLFHKVRLEIAFAHRTFAWLGKAAVHCVIVGLAKAGEEPEEKRLFSYIGGKGTPLESLHGWLTAYLFAATKDKRAVLVSRAKRPLATTGKLEIGSKPVDGGYLIFEPNERAIALAAEPNLADWLQPFVGAEEYLNGGQRWIAALQDCPANVLRGSGILRRRLADVRS